MSHNNDRDPTDLRALATLVTAVYGAEGVEAEEQTAKALLDALLAQGVLTPAEHAGAYLEAVEFDSFLDVRVEGLGWVRVDLEGSIDVIPED